MNKSVIQPVLLISMLLLGLPLMSYSQLFLLSGKLLRQEDSQPIPNAHIINLSRSTGTVSLHDGSFHIYVQNGDKIRFQAVGFITEILIINENTNLTEVEKIIFLQKRIYELSEVRVVPYATYSEFKQAFIEYRDTVEEYKLELPELPLITEYRPQGGVVIKGAITELYNTYSQRGKQIKKYNEVLEQEALAIKANKKYNPRVVTKVTKLTDPKEIEEFMEFCNLNQFFILNAKEYELYQAIQDCFENYTASKSSEE